MKRIQKRAPGAGRPPMDPGLKKVTLSLRLPASMRVALESAAKGRRSLGGEIEARLNASLAKDRKELMRSTHIVGLAEVVARTALGVERRTKRQWNMDRYTQLQLSKAIDLILYTYSSGEVVVPPAVTADADHLGESVAGGMLSSLDYAPEPPAKDIGPDMYYPEEWWGQWQLNQNLRFRSPK
jgi:hypothetical protein